MLEQNDAQVVLTLRLALIAVCLPVTILLLMSESWFEPLLYLFVIGVSIVLNMGTNVFKSSVSETTFSIAAILQLVLSMDYSIILTNRYRQEPKKTDDRLRAMRSAPENAFSSVTGSAMTTFSISSGVPETRHAIPFRVITTNRDDPSVLVEHVFTEANCPEGRERCS